MVLKKSALVLSLVVLMTMFTFVGCGGNDDSNNGTTENGTTIEKNDEGIIDETEKGVEDLGEDVKNGAEDIVDDTENMLDGNDVKDNNNNSKANLAIILPNTNTPIKLKKLIVIKENEPKVIAIATIKYNTLNIGSIIVNLKFKKSYKTFFTPE